MKDLLTRQLMAETDAHEERRLLEWRRESPANEARYARLTRVWKHLDRVRTTATRPVPDARKVIDGAGRDLRPPRTRWGLGRPLGRGALLLAGLASAAGVALMLTRPPPVPPKTFGAVEFIAGPYEYTTIRLDDGTVARLTPGSRIQFDGRSAERRQVFFDGTGYFAVAHDESRPFIIRTAGGNAEVLGTRFEIRARDEALRVVVVDGSVALQSAGGREKVSANQMGHAAADRPPSVVDVENVNDFLGWVNGLFVFQSTPLSRVAQELSEHYGVEIVIEEEELARRHVTAWLQEQSFDAAMAAVCGAVGAICTVRPDGAAMRLPHSRAL